MFYLGLFMGTSIVLLVILLGIITGIAIARLGRAKRGRNKVYNHKFDTWIDPKNYIWERGELKHLPTGEVVANRISSGQGISGTYWGPKDFDKIATREELEFVSGHIVSIVLGLMRTEEQKAIDLLKSKYLRDG